MSKPLKIGLYLLLAIVIIVLVAAGLIAFWARPGRLNETQCSDLVRMAWDSTQAGELKGDRVLIYRLGSREYRVKDTLTGAPRYPVLYDIISDFFQQTEPDADFLARLRIRHRGRVRAAGIICERVQLSPGGYAGDSTEIWVDPESGHVLSWRRLDADGGMIRGYRYTSVEITDGSSEAAVEDTGDTDHDWPILEENHLLTVEQLVDLSENRPLIIPEWLPPGFELTGGRMINSLDPPVEMEGVFPGGGIGRMRRDAGRLPGPLEGIGQGQMQLIFSDGLNTITVILYHPQRLFGAGIDPARVEDILQAKADEVRRIFHVSMASRVFPAGIAIVFGGVAPDVLRQVAESIILPEPPEGMGIPPGPGREGAGGPGFNRRGFREEMGQPPGSGRGPGAGTRPAEDPE